MPGGQDHLRSGSLRQLHRLPPSRTRRFGTNWLPSAVYSIEQITADDPTTTAPVKTLIVPGESFLVDGCRAFILWPPEAK